MDKVSHQESSKPRCIIHHPSSKEDIREHLVKLQNYESWLSLLEAAKLRNYSQLLQIAEDLQEREVPCIYYHRKCRSLFTMKRDLETLKRKAEENLEEEAGTSGGDMKRPSRRSSSESRIYKPECIFCGKTKYLKRSSSREKLIQATQLRVDQTLRACATQRRDENILAVTSRDIVAAEACYHASCYKNYTRVKKTGEENVEESEQNTETDADDLYRQIEMEAHEDLFKYIRTVIIPEKKVVLMTSLTAELAKLMQTKGIQVMKDSTKKHIRRKLESEFHDSIYIFSDDKGKLVVVPESVTIEDIVLENLGLQKELRLWKTKSTNVDRIIDQASSHIRSVIKTELKPTPWPYHPSDLTNESFAVPEHLERFFIGLLSGDPDNKSLSQRIRTLVQSFSQDIVYAVTCGQQKPPKHLLLPYAVKTLTGNVEVIQTLNRFGHGVSYSQLEENDTGLCLQKLAATINQQVVLPASIQPHVFTNLAWDNIDRLEETLTGKGTSHRVNGIAVQRKVYGPHLPKPSLPTIHKQKQRTISTENQELEVYIAGERVGPQPLMINTNYTGETKGAAKMAQGKNMLWILARQINTTEQKIPSWTGFNISTRDQVSTQEDVIGYLPTINAPATHLTTVFEILRQSELIRKELQLKSIVVVMDQALYAKAAEVLWKNRTTYANIILRMGTFHTICNALSIIGKRFEDAGLRDLLIEAGIVAEGSVGGVIDGKMYNRAVRVHKYIYEALMRLAWGEFRQWIDENLSEKTSLITSLMNELTSLREELSQEKFDRIQQSAELEDLLSLWNDFLDHLRHNNGELSAFWMSYVDIVEDVLLGLLRASREGNWFLHLSAIRCMIPWCFAYDKLNYARYLAPYYAEMSNLPLDHPDVYEEFSGGTFSVQISRDNPFGRIPVDQTTEVTVNKDTQTPGGTTRFSLKSGAVKRYYITAEHRSAFLRQLRDMVHFGKTDLHHTELQKPRVEKDEEAVSTVTDLIQSWVNPFAESKTLIIISTAKKAPQNITDDLLKAYQIGEQSYAAFKEERLESDPPKKKFHEPMKMNKLKTCSHMQKQKEVKTSSRTIVLKADRSLFGRIIVMAQGRNLQMTEILSHPLGPLPWALSTPEGLLRKTNKASLASSLQKNVTVADKIPENSATIVDGMNLVQRVRGDEATFGDVAKSVLNMALRDGVQSQRIDVVFDRYQHMSIKNSERKMRGEEQGHHLQNIAPSQIVRQWRKYLQRVDNKTSLVTFIVNEWMKTECRERLGNKELFVTDGEKCYKITREGNVEVSALKCSQEEADGRLLLHAAHAQRHGYETVVISSEDTDVFIMCLAFHDTIGAKLFQKCGTRGRTRILDIGKIVASHGTDVCKAILGMHAYTGCDTVSAFAGKGKANALKLLMNSKDIQETFTELGLEWDLTPDFMDQLEAFTCHLYAPKSPALKVNDLRYHLFCAKKGEIESHQLPPCRDCLVRHAQRANYQAAIWRRCLEQDPQTPSPIGRGWKLEKDQGVDQLVVHWMDGQPAPEAVLDLLACDCSRKCARPKCVCLENGLRCTDMCRLQDCDNQASNQDFGEVEDDEEAIDDYDY